MTFNLTDVWLWSSIKVMRFTPSSIDLFHLMEVSFPFFQSKATQSKRAHFRTLVKSLEKLVPIRWDKFLIDFQMICSG